MKNLVMKKKLIIYCPWGVVNKTDTLSSMPLYLLEQLNEYFDLEIYDPSNMDDFKFNFFDKLRIKFLLIFDKFITLMSFKSHLQFQGAGLGVTYILGSRLNKIANKIPNQPILTFGVNATRFYKGKNHVYQFIDGIYSYKIDYYIDRNKLFYWENYNIKNTDVYGIINSEKVFCTSNVISQIVLDFLNVNRPDSTTIIKTVGTASNLPEKNEFCYVEPQSEIGICFIYSNFERKNGDFVLRIAEKLEYENYKFHFIGQKPKLLKKDFKNVIFHGFVDKNKNIDNYLNIIKQCHINIMPTKGDLTPHVICECNSYGIPTIANNVGGIKDLLGDGGFLINGFEELDYINAINKIVENLEYCSLESFRKYRNEQNWSVVAKKITSAINNLD
jgi:glycosyltransferase involved in cell wall biosynthesis